MDQTRILQLLRKYLKWHKKVDVNSLSQIEWQIFKEDRRELENELNKLMK